MSSTNDLDREVRDLLDERAAWAGAPPPFGRSVRRRVRGRQSLTAAGAAVVVSLVVLPFVVVPSLLRQDDRKGQSEPRDPVTSTVYGVSITYPNDWTLLQLNDHLTMEGTETSSLFQLSNFDPLDDNHLICPLPSGEVPEGGVILFVQEILTTVDAPEWPVDVGDGTATFDTCGQRVARWQIGGRTFEAGVFGDLGGPAYGDLVEAFRSMTFEPPDDDPPLGAQEVTVGDAYVLASGRENGEPWNLLAFRFRDISDNVLCLVLDPSGPPDAMCLPNPVQNFPFDIELSATRVSGTLLAFGKVPRAAEDVRTLAGRSLTLHPLPAGLRFPFDAFVGPADEEIADGAGLVQVDLVDAGGDVIDRQQWIEPASLEEGAPEVRAFDHAFGELWWLYDDGERLLLKTQEGVVETLGERILPEGEHLRVRTYTFTRDTDASTEYETIVFGVSSGEGTQVTLLLTSGETLNASVHSLEYRLEGPDLIDVSLLFWASVPGAFRGEVVAVDTGCRVLAREPLRPDTPPPSLPSPAPEPELPCIGP